MSAITTEVRSELGVSMRVCNLRRALFAVAGLGAVVSFTFPLPPAAIPHRIVNRAPVDKIPGAKYARSVSIIDARRAPSAAVLYEQWVVAASIVRRYRVAHETVATFVVTAYQAGEESFMDPLLILAVIAIESSFNPAAESVLGAKGLMQIMAKFHTEKIISHGGRDVLLDPEANIHIGTQILHEYLSRFGETEIALQIYAGAINDPNSVHAHKVLAEHSRIKQALTRLRRAA